MEKVKLKNGQDHWFESKLCKNKKGLIEPVINQIFKFAGSELKCVSDFDGCEGCEASHLCSWLACCSSERDDKKNVHFIEN